MPPVRRGSVVLQGARADQRGHAGAGEHAAAEAASPVEGVDQQPVGRPPAPVGGVVGILVELPDQQPAYCRGEGVGSSRISKVHSSIDYPHQADQPLILGVMTSTVAEVYDRDGIVQVPGTAQPVRGRPDQGRLHGLRSPRTTRWRSTTEYPRKTRWRSTHGSSTRIGGPISTAGELALELMLDSRILDVVTTLIGPALGAQSMFYFKPPGARGQALHQDNMFLRAAPRDLPGRLDRDRRRRRGERRAGGRTRFAPRVELVCPEQADLTESFTNAEVPVPEGLSKVQTRMKAGDVLFFHGSVVHGSRPNTSYGTLPPLADLPLHPGGEHRDRRLLQPAGPPGPAYDRHHRSHRRRPLRRLRHAEP